MSRSGKFDPSDPLSRALAPPPDETEEERAARLDEEARAKDVSDSIDVGIEEERVAQKTGPKPVKVLLLGQSESGKSTTLKNFQLMHDQKAFQRERASWRAVIQLNLVRSFHLVMDVLTREHEASHSGSRSKGQDPAETLPPDLLKTKLRLVPLFAIEDILIKQLTPIGTGEVEATQLPNRKLSTERVKHYIREVSVISGTGWKDAFSGLVREQSHRESFESGDDIDWDDPNDPGRVLHECAEDMKNLWNDSITQNLLNKHNLRMQEVAGFFLDQIDRITAPRYIPTDGKFHVAPKTVLANRTTDDILKARIKTLGVTEHRFTLQRTGELNRDWRVYDVGGHRSQRRFQAAWAPYFDDIDAIIFLAPISCFDQTLAEDPKTNRLADSVSLWTMICSNELLKKTNLILFLNKTDILRAKLAAGIKLGDYVTSYGGRPNDYASVTEYLKRKFAGILKDKSPSPRVFYCYLTTATDPTSTKLILRGLQDMIMRVNLVGAQLMV